MIIFKGRVIDGNGGVIEDGLVTVEGSKITRVCSRNDWTNSHDAQVIEVKDGTIMPGLIDLHVHLALSGNSHEINTTHPFHSVCTALNDMKKMLNAGYTGMRECGGLSNYLKAPWEAGEIVGPRIFSSARCFVQSEGHFDYIKEYPIEFTKRPGSNVFSEIVDGITEVRRAARIHFREGADFLKVMITPGAFSQNSKSHVQEFSDEEIRTFVEEADKFNTYVAVHAHANVGIKAAIRCGVHCIEHASFMTEEDAEAMAKKGTWYVPTLSTSYRLLEYIDQAMPGAVPKITNTAEHLRKSVRMAKKVGVRIGCGADFVGDEICPHGLEGLEIKLLHEYGEFTPMEAIMAATKTNSEFILRDKELGTLEENKYADLIVVKGNPLDNLDLLVGPDNIKVVVQNGIIYKNEA